MSAGSSSKASRRMHGSSKAGVTVPTPALASAVRSVGSDIRVCAINSAMRLISSLSTRPSSGFLALALSACELAGRSSDVIKNFAESCYHFLNTHVYNQTIATTKKTNPKNEDNTMSNIQRNGTQASAEGPADWFTGTVRIDPLFDAPDPARVAGASVTFEPGARTAWHTHPLGQTLIITSGCGWVQCEGEPKEEV